MSAIETNFFPGLVKLIQVLIPTQLPVSDWPRDLDRELKSTEFNGLFDSVMTGPDTCIFRYIQTTAESSDRAYVIVTFEGLVIQLSLKGDYRQALRQLPWGSIFWWDSIDWSTFESAAKVEIS